MRSPKFVSRGSELATIFSVDNLKATWRRKARAKLKERYIPDPIEYLDFHQNLDSRCREISKLVSDGRYQPKPAVRVLMEKSKGLCRQLVLPSVSDAMVLQRLSDALYISIDGKAPTNKAFFEQEDHRSTSEKRDESGAPQYGSVKAWLDFQQELLDFAERKSFIVVTDIANYYDCISYQHLRNAIAGQIEVKESILDTLIFVLSGLLWQPDYMPRTEVGLPQIDFEASRILAHCLLYELDDFLAKQKHVDFARYMDDIDVGVNSMPEALAIIRDIDLVLQTRQLRLNSGKTRILTSTEAEAHFRVRDNRRVDFIQRSVKRKQSSGLSLKRERVFVEKMLLNGIKNNYFALGNGEKIIKRLVYLALKSDAYIPDDVIFDLICKRPNLREAALTYLLSFKVNVDTVSVLHRFVSSDLIIDDVSYLLIVKKLCEAYIDDDVVAVGLTTDLIYMISQFPNFGMSASFWLASKVFNCEELLELLRQQKSIWQRDAWLGRIVGGFQPLFRNTPQQAAFALLVSGAKNESLDAVVQFHDAIFSDAATHKAVKNFILTPNKSRPLQITHAKFLMLLSYLQNPAVPTADGKKIVETFKIAFSEPHYRSIAERCLSATIL